MDDDFIKLAQSSTLAYSGQPKEPRCEAAAREVQELFKVRRVQIMRYILSLCHNSADAEDIAQEAFFRMYLYLSAGGAIENSLSWLFTVSRRLVLDRFRRSTPGDRSTISEQAIADIAEDPSPSVEQRVLDAERLQELYHVIERLSGAQRECVLLRARGVPFREISEILGIPLRAAVYHTEAALEVIKRKVKR